MYLKKFLLAATATLALGVTAVSAQPSLGAAEVTIRTAITVRDDRDGYYEPGRPLPSHPAHSREDFGPPPPPPPPPGAYYRGRPL